MSFPNFSFIVETKSCIYFYACTDNQQTNVKVKSISLIIALFYKYVIPFKGALRLLQHVCLSNVTCLSYKHLRLIRYVNLG